MEEFLVGGHAHVGDEFPTRGTDSEKQVPVVAIAVKVAVFLQDRPPGFSEVGVAVKTEKTFGMVGHSTKLKLTMTIRHSKHISKNYL